MKGQVLVNCGAMGLDPATLSMSGYLEALAAHNAANDPNHKGEPNITADPERLRRFMNAHGVAGNA